MVSRIGCARQGLHGRMRCILESVNGLHPRSSLREDVRANDLYD